MVCRSRHTRCDIPKQGEHPARMRSTGGGFQVPSKRSKRARPTEEPSTSWRSQGISNGSIRHGLESALPSLARAGAALTASTTPSSVTAPPSAKRRRSTPGKHFQSLLAAEKAAAASRGRATPPARGGSGLRLIEGSPPAPSPSLFGRGLPTLGGGTRGNEANEAKGFSFKDMLQARKAR